MPPGPLDQIFLLDPGLRAFNFVDVAPPTQEASGSGALQGLPIAVKDNIDVAGMPTTAASEVLAGNVATRDAPVVARLRAAGALICGKTNLDEFAYGVFSRPTVNPWGPEHIPGGSSGGSAAAVAAGMCAGAIGTDTAGSIRIPSALCGVTGLKPRQVVDMTGIIPLAPSLDTCGPIARDPQLLAALWQAMTGPRDTSAREAFRVGVFDVAGLDVDSDVGLRYRGFVDSLRQKEPFEVIAKEVPRLEQWERSAGIVLADEARKVHEERGWWPEKASLYSAAVRTAMDAASRMPSQKVDEARSAMGELRRVFEGLMTDVDVVVMPTTPCLAPRVADVVGDARRAWVRRLTRFAAPLNFCSLAAATIPLWGRDDELPWGVDAIAADEWTALDFAQAAAPPPRTARR